MQNVYSSAAPAGIRGVSPLPPMLQSPTTKFGHVQSDGRSRARSGSEGGFAGAVRGRLRGSVQDLFAGRSKAGFAGRSKTASVGPRGLGPRRPRVGAIDARA